MKIIVVHELDKKKSSFMMFGRHTLRFKYTKDSKLFIERRPDSSREYQLGVQGLIDRAVKIHCNGDQSCVEIQPIPRV